MSKQDFDVYLARASNLSQRYRDEATDKPSQAMDSLILTASRRTPVNVAQAEPVSWFGGGMDLTPYYGFEEDAEHFHRTCREALAPFGAQTHARFKKWCDEYFYLKHRRERFKRFLSIKV